MIPKPSSDTPRDSLRRRGRTESTALARLKAWFGFVALFALVIALVPGPARAASRLSAYMDGASTDASRAVSGARPARASHRAVCRIGAKAQRPGTHLVRARYDGSARAIHERDTSKAEIDDSDLDDAGDASFDADDSRASLGNLVRDRAAGCPSRGTTETDPSRFTAGRGLPRGPPV